MAQDLERIQTRLGNIRTVSPILAALRTISLGSWQMALNRVRNLQDVQRASAGFVACIVAACQRQGTVEAVGTGFCICREVKSVAGKWPCCCFGYWE